MQQFRNILVGVDLTRGRPSSVSDLSPVAQEAIQSGIWLARTNAAKLTFFSAYEPAGTIWSMLGEEERSGTARAAEEAASRVLSELVGQAKQEGVGATAKLAQGTAWVQIIRQALRDRHDLVVVGTRDLKGLRRVLLGSTSLKLVHECPCAVWVTKPRTEARPRSILVASDLGPVSEEALRVVVSLARLTGAQVHLLHVVDYPLDRLWSTGLPDAKTAEYHRQVRAAAEKVLHGQLQRADPGSLNPPVQVHLLDGVGLPDLGVLQFIEDHRVDLLALGTMSRSGLAGSIMGHTAERLLPEVHCSVLAVKAPDFQGPVTLEP
jgi:universal stress protein E